MWCFLAGMGCADSHVHELPLSVGPLPTDAAAPAAPEREPNESVPAGRQGEFVCRPEHSPHWQSTVLNARTDEPWMCEARIPDPQGWVWEIADREGETLMLRSADDPLWFTAPEVGDYGVVLRPWSADSLDSPAVADLRVGARESFEVELVWYPTEPWGRELPWSESAQLDLHVFAVNAWGECWDSPRYDCHAGSKQPSFGTSSEFVTRWRRGLEDGDGFGPVTVSAPGEPLAGHYLVGVHHLGPANDSPGAVAEVTLRSWGKVLTVWESPVLGGGEFWVAGRMEISQGDPSGLSIVREAGVVYRSIKDAPCE